MANYHSKDSRFLINDSGASLRNISGDLTDVGLPLEVATADVSGFGDTWTSHVIGLKSYSVSLSGIWTDTASVGTATVLDGLLGVATIWQYGPAGSAGGKIKYSGSGTITSFNPSSAIGDKVGFSATLSGNGAVTIGTF